MPFLSRRSFAALCVTVVAGLSLVSCSSGTTDAPATTGPVTNAPTDEPDPSEEALSAAVDEFVSASTTLLDGAGDAPCQVWTVVRLAESITMDAPTPVAGEPVFAVTARALTQLAELDEVAPDAEALRRAADDLLADGAAAGWTFEALAGALADPALVAVLDPLAERCSGGAVGDGAAGGAAAGGAAVGAAEVLDREIQSTAALEREVNGSTTVRPEVVVAVLSGYGPDQPVAAVDNGDGTITVTADGSVACLRPSMVVGQAGTVTEGAC